MSYDIYEDWWGQADLFDPPYVYKAENEYWANKTKEEKEKESND